MRRGAATRRQRALDRLRPALSTAPAYACHCDGALGTTMGRLEGQILAYMECGK